MVSIPARFQPHIFVDYPSWNYLPFEEWLSRQHIPETEREYLGVWWCSFQVNHNWGKDEAAMRHLQTFVDELDRGRKYWTAVQYDDGCGVDFKDLDIRVYGMSQRLPTQQIDYVLPLIGQLYEKRMNDTKVFKASFVGNITHPMRKRLVDTFANKPDFYVSTVPHNPLDYNRILAASTFALAPIGYGKTSFRAFEAMYQGAIPVFIGDVLEPHGIDCDTYGVKIKEEHLLVLDEILTSQLPLVEMKQQKIRELWDEYFTFEGCYNKIIKDLQQ